MVVTKQTITIVNQSGKVVSTSKHLVNVFKEAKTAYGERKAEIKAKRRLEAEEKEKEKKWHRSLEALTLEDRAETASRASSRRTARRGSEDGRHIKRKPVPERSKTTRRPTTDRGVTDSFITNTTPRSPQTRASSVDGDEPHLHELTRRHTDTLTKRETHAPRRSKTRRSASADDIDMDLAYGDLPPPPPLPARKTDIELELRCKIINLETLLDEFNCLQHSITHIVEHLSSKPEALAAVALTLGEISNLAAKLAPGAIAGLSKAYPAAIALLASPQFAIAAGVGVGVTIIAFGGYKIIKKIRAGKEGEEEVEERLLEWEGRGEVGSSGSGEMEELREIDRIENWRRGIAEVEAGSIGTSVEGEFLTPQAAKTLIGEGRLTEADLKKVGGSESGSGSSRRKKSGSSRSGGSKKVKAKAKKEPSGLRMLFKRNDLSSEKKEAVAN